jgi:hypothetical protein
MGTTPSPGEVSHQASLAPGHKPEWPNSEGLHVCPTSPEVAQQPPLGEQPDGLGCTPTKDRVTDLRARSLEARAPLCSLPEPGNYLSHNTHLRDINGQVPKYGLGGQGHRHPKHEQPCGYLSVLGVGGHKMDIFTTNIPTFHLRYRR